VVAIISVVVIVVVLNGVETAKCGRRGRQSAGCLVALNHGCLDPVPRGDNADRGAGLENGQARAGSLTEEAVM